MKVGGAGTGRPNLVEEGPEAALYRGAVSQTFRGVSTGPIGIDRVAEVSDKASPIEAIEGLEEGCGGLGDGGRVP